MPRGAVVVLCVLAVLPSVFAQEKPPVVLVWGEYLAAVNSREAPGTRSYLANIARSLDAVGLEYDETKDSEVEKGALRGYKFAVFPYNSNLNDAYRAEVRQFVADGGRIWASFTGDPALNELLGVRIASGLKAEYPGQFAAMRFLDAAPEGTPESVAAGSWGSHRVTPLEGTRVIANWQDGEGKDTGLPALTMNANGCYQAHVMLGGDAAGKGQMFLAVIGHFFPDIWQSAVQKAFDADDSVHGYGDWDGVAQAIERAKQDGRDVSVAEERLAAAREANDEAKALLAEGKYAAALLKVNQAGDLLRSATYPLARTREGELRAVWTGGASQDWDAVMQDLASAGLNAIFPNFCDAGGANYESDVLPRARNYERDELAACIEAARKYNIEVHPWRINWRLGKGTPERIAELTDADRLTLSDEGDTGDWLCPSDERNLKLEIAAMLEMAEKYPVDGIHFDYIRYGGGHFCYCEKCHANFERDAGVDVADWPKDVLKGGPQYDTFQDWRREQITRLVREVYKRAHEIRPDIVVSAAVFYNWPSSRVSIGQDAAAWAREGIIDLLMPMTYTDSNERLAKATEEHVRLTQGRALIAEGIGAFSSHSQFTGPDQLIQQIETSRRLGADGFCIFSYGSSLKQGFLPPLAEGCTGAQTFTPMLRPVASFSSGGATDDAWVVGEGDTLSTEVKVEARGNWAQAVKTMDATLVLQGLDGRDIREVGEKAALEPGESHTWEVESKLDAGSYRLAIRGTAILDDGTSRHYICRSRPVRALTADEQLVHTGELPAPREAEGKPRVGILDGYGAQGMLESLGGAWQVDAEVIPSVTAQAARDFQVLVITQGRGAVSVDEARATALHKWLEAGGSILATHDAVGYRDHAAIAPAVCAGGVGHYRETGVRVSNQPIIPEYYRGAGLEHAFYDHIVLGVGKDGMPLVTDGAGRPVVVGGQVGKGRYIASGIAFGLNADTEEEAPGENEGELLKGLILWLAGAEM